MEGKSFALVGGALALVLATAFVTYFITSISKPACDFSVDAQKVPFTKEGAMDYSDVLHIPEKKLTLIKGMGSNRCYVVTNDNTPNAHRALSVLSGHLSNQHLEAIGGQAATEFCRGSPIVPVEVLSEDEARPKRDVASDAAAAAEAQKKFKSHSNECAENVVVQCADSATVYKCVTGPREVYRASTECTSATQFRFNLTTRCKEFEATKSDRWIKCLQKFILNQQGPGGPAPGPVA